MPDADEPTDFRYAAFISYRHQPQDQKVAMQVQRAIESFRLPKGLAFQGASSGRTLGKCFRDEDELAASDSLPDRIREALAQSRSLIVVCSAEAAKSKWVEREIRTYAELHGRNRIFTVLADGNSDESIPALLKTRIAVTTPGQERTSEHASPLAADFRADASRKRREETLRIIAAVAGCDYDDLRQRERARKRKRIASTSVLSALLLALVMILTAYAHQSNQDMLETQSHALVAESALLLENGDRYGAIETALSALPKSATALDRPLTAEAQQALENALEIRQPIGQIWLASYRIEQASPVSFLPNCFMMPQDAKHTGYPVNSVAVSTSGYFAISDDGGNVTTYDLLTGRKLADCIMPAELAPFDNGSFVHKLAATEHYLLVGHIGIESGISCFDARTGELLWSETGITPIAFHVSYRSDDVTMATWSPDTGYAVTVMNLATQAGGTSVIEDEQAVSDVILASSTFTVDLDGTVVNCTSLGNQAHMLNLATGTARSVTAKLPTVTSLYFKGDTLIVASVEPESGGSIESQYAIEAFDSDLNRIWIREGRFVSEMIEDDVFATSLSGKPEIRGSNKAGIAISVGRESLILDPRTGDSIYERAGSRTVVGMTAIGTSAICVGHSNGAISCRDPFALSDEAVSDSTKLDLPFPVRLVEVVTLDSGTTVALAMPANSSEAIVGFRTDFGSAEQANREYSLDELIELAHATLREAGRE